MFKKNYSYKGIQLGSSVVLDGFPNIPLKVIGFAINSDYHGNYDIEDICVDMTSMQEAHPTWDLSVRYTCDFNNINYVFLRKYKDCEHAWFFERSRIKCVIDEFEKLDI